MPFSAQQAKNGLLVLIKQYQEIDQMDSIWWNNFTMNGVKAFVLNLNSIGQRQRQNGRVFFTSLGTGPEIQSVYRIPYGSLDREPNSPPFNWQSKDNDHRIPAIYQWDGDTFTFGVWLRSRSNVNIFSIFLNHLHQTPPGGGHLLLFV